MKLKYLLSLSFLMFSLVGCSNPQSTEVTPDDQEEETNFITVQSLDATHPNMIISKSGDEENLVIGSSTEDRLDTRQFENGLMNIGMESFGEDSYLLADNTVLLEDKRMDQLFRDNQINILMYNYYEVSGSQAILSGIVVGIQMSSTYAANELQNRASSVSSKILEILRDDHDIADTPVSFAIFHQRPTDADVHVVSGRFVLKSEPTTNTTLGDWKTINSSHYLYPSSTLTRDRGADAKKIDELVSTLGERINTHDHIGVSGTFKYTDDDLEQINLIFTVRFHSKMQVVATVTAISELVQELIPNTFDLEIIINSDTQSEALIRRNKGEDIFTHIY